MNINNILSPARGGDVLTLAELLGKKSSSLAFPTLFVPAGPVIKLKILLSFGLQAALSTKGYILELLWSVPVEIGVL